MNPILQSLADNPLLLAEVKSVLLRHFETKNSVESLLKIDNEVLGQYEKARLMGLERIESAFREIGDYKTIPDNPPKINKAR